MLIRKFIWKIIGTEPINKHVIDLISPRQKMLDYAIAFIDHQTRVSRTQQKVGQKGSLLGGYLEFGCYRGESFIYVYKRASTLMPWMRFFAFDSFKGLPSLKPPDDSGPFWEGQFSCSKEEFMHNLKKVDVDLKKVMCVEGWFEETLTPQLKEEKNLNIASIVYIDCDIYKSCISVLDFITDIIETGSIIIFDDWFSFKSDPEKGVQRACKEWLIHNPQIMLQDWHIFGSFGKSFIVKLSDQRSELPCKGKFLFK